MKAEKKAISVENLSKRYRLGIKEKKAKSLGGAFVKGITSPFRNFRKYRSLYKFNDKKLDGEDILWALKDISFEVKQGERIGVIGHNGAGKSTLLKILSRITPPSHGRAVIYGRISSLLEVGTGFNPELTGRENVYLNGTILGMRKKEIDAKFDEMVAFSGVDKFLDTPVKRYSSGMKVRLAFAVAAHLEPEILIIDEVLAVGDAEFQKKCLDKMKDVGKSGRTVVFVSHNMAAIAQLCDRVLWMERGCLKADGPSSRIISSYLNAGTTGHAVWVRPEPAPEASYIHLYEARLKRVDNQECTSVVNFNTEVELEILYEVKKFSRQVCILIRVTDSQGNVIWTSWDSDTHKEERQTRHPGKYKSICKLPKALLRPGRYHLSVGAIVKGSERDIQENVITFDISEVGYGMNLNRIGLIAPVCEWDVQEIA